MKSRRSSGAPRPRAMIGPPRTSASSRIGTRGPVNDSPRCPESPRPLALCRIGATEDPSPRPRTPLQNPKPVESDSVRSGGPGPSKPANPASSEETEAVGSPRIDEDAAPRGTGTPGFVVCGCQRESRRADGARARIIGYAETKNLKEGETHGRRRVGAGPAPPGQRGTITSPFQFSGKGR